MNDDVSILAIYPAERMRSPLPSPVTIMEVDRIPERRRLLELEWDYVYLGFDGTVVDPRFFRIAAEHVAIHRSDVLVFSSTEERILSGVFDGAEERFQTIGNLMQRGLMYSLANKLFSRRVFDRADSPYVAVFIHDVFLAAGRVETLSFPWVGDLGVEPPDDSEFRRFMLSYARAE